MKFIAQPLYFKPIYWKDKYYSVAEFCDLLGHHGLFVKKFYQAIKDDFYSATYTGFEDVYQFERVRGTKNNNGFVTPAVLEKKNRPCFIAFYDRGYIDFLISKEGALAFIESHQEKLADLGVSKTRIKAILHNIPFLSEKPQNTINLWDFTKKFTKNSKNVMQLAEYISSHFFDTYYPKQMPNGLVEERPMFLYLRGKRRATNFFFDLEALDYFKKNYAPLIIKKAAEIEKQNEFISIRNFILSVFGQHYSDKDLTSFIKEKALHDTYVEVDEKGSLVSKEMFLFSQGVLSMRKGAIIPFVNKYKKELQDMGCCNMNHILNQTPRYKDLPKEALPLTKIIKKHRLTQFLPQVQALVKSPKWVNTQITLQNKEKAPLFHPYYMKDTVEYFVYQKDEKAFFKKFYKAFLSLGVAKERLDAILGAKPLPKRTPDMVLIRQMLLQLGINQKHHKRMQDEILATFVNETYPVVGKKGNIKKENIFVKASTISSIGYVFKNKEAMQAFVKNHRDYFLQNKVNPLRIDDVSGVKPILPPSQDQMTLEALIICGSFAEKFKYYVHKRLLNETYLTTNSDGQVVEKNMFSPVRSVSGHIVYAIDKKAIPTLEEKIKTYKIHSDRQRNR